MSLTKFAEHNNAEKIVEMLLGHKGRMIAGSKSGYRKRRPKNLTCFNANVVVEGLGKIWYGDLDITLDEALLVRLAQLLEREVYVLQEMDGRFDNEDAPKIEKAVYKVNKVPFLSWHVYEGEVCIEFYERSKKSGVIQEKSKRQIDKILEKLRESVASV
jgi:hypothetical protein